MLFNTWSDFFDANAQLLSTVRSFVTSERQRHTVYPPPNDVFTAFKLTPLHAVKLVILGQDPYHGEGQAMGLAFSVRSGVAPPPSLANIFRELKTDMGADVMHKREARYLAKLRDPLVEKAYIDGDLSPWAERGCLLLNETLTVRQGEAYSHAVVRNADGTQTYPWRDLTTVVVKAVICSATKPHFIVWGSHAKATLERAVGKPLRRKLRLANGADVYSETIDGHGFTAQHSAHPSPLSAHKGFFGSRPFSTAFEVLRLRGETFDWSLE